MSWIHHAAKLAVALTLMISASAWAAAGYVSDAMGDVSAVVGKAESQPVNRNDAIAPGTIINTGDRSHAVLRFEDGQVVVMQSNSSFHVREYSYEIKYAEKSHIVFAMLKGGMRFVTGLIGQQNKEAFKLVTPNATIGIRGTDFMVVMGNSPMYGQVMSGSISMTNAAGTTVFTAGQTAIVASAAALPAPIAATAVPAGTFTQLAAIPVPPPAPAGGAAPGGATTTTSAATAGTATGISATTVAIGAGVAAGIAAAAGGGTTTTTHHP